MDVIRTVVFLPMFIGLAYFMFRGTRLILAIGSLLSAFFISFYLRNLLIENLSLFLAYLEYRPDFSDCRFIRVQPAT